MNIIEIAADINREHEAAFGKAREALEHARRAGELLIEAKAQVEHGNWLPWLAEHVEFSARTAQSYMRLAARWPELESKCATAAHLPLRDALAALADPDGGGQIVQRLEAIATDLAGDIDDAELTARMAALRDDSEAVISASTDVKTCGRIADACRAVERAAAARRLHAMREVGRVQLFGKLLEAAVAEHPQEPAFWSERKTAEGVDLVVIVASVLSPDHWHYCSAAFRQRDTENIAAKSRRPIRFEALPIALADMSLPVDLDLQPCDRETALSLFWSHEMAA